MEIAVNEDPPVVPTKESENDIENNNKEDNDRDNNTKEDNNRDTVLLVQLGEKKGIVTNVA
ncbi:Hypothetical predicted protein [Paramuricea clavata]|uniref:Uncharacterized protein n=1 Tax=Paramuricea clavata TaxID=317549 RepID=A0A7D9LVH8_PARCT|nr:Hypothetical predicted protein [Paramuricea clavata]